MKNDNEENDGKIPLAWESLVIFLVWVIEWSGPFNISLKDTEEHRSQFSIKKTANQFLYASLLTLNGKISTIPIAVSNCVSRLANKEVLEDNRAHHCFC